MQPFVAEPRRLIELRRRVVRRLTASLDTGVTPGMEREGQEWQQILMAWESWASRTWQELETGREQFQAAMTSPVAALNTLSFLRDEWQFLADGLESILTSAPDLRQQTIIIKPETLWQASPD